MTRVAFIFRGGETPISVVNYLGNLFTAIAETPGIAVEPLIVTGTAIASTLPTSWPRTEVAATRMLDLRTPQWLARGAVKRVAGTDLVLERWCKTRRTEVISHSVPGRRSIIPHISWLPDLQHKRRPEFFSPSELAMRDRNFAEVCRDARVVVLSSQDACNDVHEFFPAARGKTRVLRFVDCTSRTMRSRDNDPMPLRVATPYVLLPNQFWIHKNHAIVIDALRLLAQRGREVRVVCTGDTRDYRHPNHFADVMRRSTDAKVEHLFRVLGIIPFAELVQLMRSAAAILNPSLFEGWSTTVEEAKSLGKTVVLSDIPVHREQAPPRGIYFAPHDAGALADALWSAVDGFDPAAERDFAARASATLPARREAFANEYASIVRQSVA